MASVKNENGMRTPPNGDNRCQIITKTYSRTSKRQGCLYNSIGEIPIEYDNVCRICLDGSDMKVNIFAGSSGNLPSIASKIQHLINEVPIYKGDELPEVVCSSCLHLIDVLDAFKKKYIASYKMLRRFLIREPSISPEPSHSMLIDQIDELPTEETKRECTLEFSEMNPLASIYNIEPASARRHSESDPGSGSPIEISKQKSSVISKSNDPSSNGKKDPSTDFGFEDTEDDDAFDEKLNRIEHDPIDRNDIISVKPFAKTSSPHHIKAGEMMKPPNSYRRVNRRDCLRIHRNKRSPFSRDNKQEIKTKAQINVTVVNMENVTLKKRLELERSCVERGEQCRRCHEQTTLPPSEHLKECQAAYRCGECEKPFATLSLIQRHRRVHTGERPFKCDKCQKAFSQKETLQRHYLSLHGPKPFICPLCDKAYATKYMLSSHVADVHDRQRKGIVFQCQQCDKTFKHSSGLSRHQNFHNGTIFNCKICHRPFTDQSAISRHLKKCHYIK